MARNLYAAGIAAGKAGGAYKASLYDIEGVGYEKEASKRMFDIGEEKRGNVIGAISAGIELTSNVFSKFQTRRETTKSILELTGGKAEQTYGETKLWDLARGKAKLGEGETKWGEVGERLGVLFGGAERKYDWEGKDWTESELLAKSKVERASERGIPVKGISGETSKVKTMADEVGGVDDKTKLALGEREKGLLKWGPTFSKWGAEGPRGETGADITQSRAGKMSEFQEYIKSSGTDIGTTGTIESWGPKTQKAYGELYEEWGALSPS